MEGVPFKTQLHYHNNDTIIFVLLFTEPSRAKGMLMSVG